MPPPPIILPAELFASLKHRYGVTQVLVSKMCGVSRQALTDIKAGRRRFSKKMAFELLANSQDQPWAKEVEEALSGFLEDRNEIPRRLLQNARSSPPTERRLPIVSSPVVGDPRSGLEFTGEDVTLPMAIEQLDADPREAYVLVLQNDDVIGRLRCGDHVVVTQNSKLEREIMVVEHGGLLRLARRAKYISSLPLPEDEQFPYNGWIALDSGLPIPDAHPKGAVIGIVWALL